MEDNGALSNPQVQLALLRLADLRAQLRERGCSRIRLPRITEPRPPRILEEITKVLVAAEGPLTIGEIHAAVQATLGRTVNRRSVKSALSNYSSGARKRFDRVSRGRFATNRDAIIPTPTLDSSGTLDHPSRGQTCRIESRR